MRSSVPQILTHLFLIACTPTPLFQGHFMYVSNLEEYGHLLNADNYEISHLHNDMYQIFDNRLVRSPYATDTSSGSV